MLERKKTHQLMYPDVLGLVTGGARIDMEHLQVALGIFPRQAFISQPFEAVIVLQNQVNQPTQVKVAVRLPTTDKKGAPAVIDTPKPQIALTLQPGEVGVLRMPIIAHPPTQPGKEFPVRLAVRYRTPPEAVLVRPPAGGVPPAVLEISSYRLQALREVVFDAQTWHESADIITAYFDLAPHRLAETFAEPKSRYDTLWTAAAMPQENVLSRARLQEARGLASPAAYASSYHAFLEAAKRKFAARGYPLHQGEAMAIAKMMTYTLDDAPRMEQNVEVEETRWFQGLMQLLAARPELLDADDFDRNEIIAEHLFFEVLYEAILMGFHVIEHKVTENLGTFEERMLYASSVLAWFSGRGRAELSYVYLPLVLGGMTISRLVRATIAENPWDMVDALYASLRERIEEAHGENILVLDMLNDLLNKASILLRNQRIQRP